MKAQPTYEIRIAGQLDEAMLGSLAGLDVSCHDGITIITGQFDQAALHGKLELIRVAPPRAPGGSPDPWFPRRAPG